MVWSFGDGFDLYATSADMATGYWDSQSGQILFTAGRFAGSQAMRCQGSAPVLIKSSAINDAVHHVVVAFRQTAAISGTSVGASWTLFDGATAQCSIVFQSGGAILLVSGAPNSGTTLATYSGAFPVTNTWYAFEFEVIINSTSGRFRVRKNGNTVDDFDSGAVLNTRTTANNYANALRLAQTFGINAQDFDDLFWRSDASSVAWLGDIRCYTRMPASDASVTFSRSTGATNFSCVDEAQQNALTDYVFDSTPGHADFYSIGATATTPAAVVAVTTRGYMQKSDAGTRTAAMQLKSGATTVASPTLTLSSSGWLWTWRIDTVDPATGATWTNTAVNNVQIGPVTVT